MLPMLTRAAPAVLDLPRTAVGVRKKMARSSSRYES